MFSAGSYYGLNKRLIRFREAKKPRDHAREMRALAMAFFCHIDGILWYFND